jgi:hypothetical protein
VAQLHDSSKKLEQLFSDFLGQLFKSKDAEAASILSHMESEVYYDAEDIVDVDEDELSDKMDVSSEDEDESIYENAEPVKSKWPNDFFPVIPSRRVQLPAEMKPFNFSVGSFLRKNIGRDFSNISMPIGMNEPLNFLQRLCEELDYSELLDRANKSPNSIERLALVSAFAVSAYSFTASRAERKPFNPLLGETFECVREDKGFKFLAEKVSHKPVILACNAISMNFEYYQSQLPKTKFWGKSMEIIPNGLTGVKLLRLDENYRWNKVNSTVKNILGGQPYIEHSGQMQICNLTDGSYCVVKFKSGSSSSKNEILGIIYDSDGNECASLYGSWNQMITFEDTEGVREIIWRCNKLPENSSKCYGFTKFAIELNELNPELIEFLPSTDSRFRPDQRLFEEGKWDEAEKEKNRLEEAQRARRKQMESQNQVWEPRWFVRAFDDRSKMDFWKFNEKYWTEREARNFKKKLLLF